MTGDDLAVLRKCFSSPSDLESEKRWSVQLRQNVIFEAGLSFALIQKETILLRIGPLREMSDISGVNFLTLSNSSKDRARLRNRLQSIGCEIKQTGEDMEN